MIAGSMREVVEGPQPQGEDERVIYSLDISKWGSSPTKLSFVVKDMASDGTYTDVTREMTSLVMASRARHANVATITTDDDHGLMTDDYVDVFDCEGVGYDAEHVKVTVSSPTIFTYANTGAEEATAVDVAGRVATADHSVVTVVTSILLRLPKILKAIIGHEYRVEVRFTVSGQDLELPFIILGEM